MTSSIIAGLIAIYLGIQLIRKKLWWVDTLAIITLGYICGNNGTQVGNWIGTGISWAIAGFNFVASLFQ